MLLVTTGCLGSPSSSTEAVDGQGGSSDPSTLVVDLVAEPVSMDPHQVTDINSMRVLENMYDKLVGWSEEGFEMVPKLAESWEESEDGKVYTFKLREDVKFQDGTPVNAEAVKFSFDRMLQEDHPFHHTGPFPFAQFYFGKIDKVEVEGDYTVSFTLKERFSPFLSNLTTVTGSIINPAAVEEWDTDFSLHGGGSGPFALEEWSKGVHTKLKANADHYEGAPLVETAIFQPIVEDLVRVTKLKNGEADIIVDVNPDSIEELEADENMEVIQQPGPHVWYVGLNNQKEPFNDVKVRQAVNYAVDKEVIVNDILKGTGVVSTQPLADSLLGHDADLEGYPYDPEKAKQLLAEAGYPDGFSVNFLIPESGSGMQSPVPMSTAVQGYLQAVGITVEIVKMEWGTFLNEINQGAGDKYDMYALSWMSGNGDADLSLANLLHTDAHPPGFNSGYYSNPKVDELIDKASSTSDPAERESYYLETQKLISEDAPWIFIDHAKQTAAHSSNIQGFNLHPSHVFNLSKVKKE